MSVPADWLAFDPSRVPAGLRERDRWVVWDLDERRRKTPRAAARPTRNVDATSPDAWCSYADVRTALATADVAGPGIALGDGVAGVDLDHCRDPRTGVIEPWAVEVIRALDSYAEVSPSATGVKVFLFGRLPEEAVRQEKVLKLEIYDRKRYFTVTGSHLDGTPTDLRDRAEQLRTLYDRQQSSDLVELTRLFGLHIQDRGDKVDIRCPWAEEHSTPDGRCDATIFLTDGRPSGFECLHASHADRRLPDLLKLFKLDRDRTRTAAPPVSLGGYELTDTGNAEHFEASHGQRVRFDHGRRSWFVFDGQHWVADRTEEVDRFALESIRARKADALALDDLGKQNEALRWAMRSESRPNRESLVKLARKLASIAVTGDDWDTDPWLLGVQNGVVDLRTGERRDGRPSDAVTKVAPTAYDPAARAPRWEAFVREIFAGCPEVADYARRVVGYALTGITTEQVFWILWGEGSNGKSTLIETLRHALGDAYAWTMPFPAAGWTNAMSDYQKASLAGQRFVTSSEVTRRGYLDEEFIKSLTGGDQVNARHPYGRPFNFVPVAKIFLRVNHKPIIRDQSHAMWRRVNLVPFEQTFPVNPALGDELRAEATGVLAWAVRGCLEWQRDGLRAPTSVSAATQEYRAESDPLAEFLDERCVVEPAGRVQGRPLYEEYLRWCEARHEKPEDRLSQRAFGVRMKARFAPIEGRHVVYTGLALRFTTGGDL